MSKCDQKNGRKRLKYTAGQAHPPVSASKLLHFTTNIPGMEMKC